MTSRLTDYRARAAMLTQESIGEQMLDVSGYMHCTTTPSCHDVKLTFRGIRLC